MRLTAAALLLAATVLPAPAMAETLQESATRIVHEVGEHDKFITFNSENDMYASGNDRNYTNGARMTYFDFGMKPPAFARTIDKLVPTFSINETTSIYYSLGHNLYTPKDITRKTQDPDDRPWAAFLYASAGLSTITDNHIDNIEATLGVIGPPALGRQVQTFVHENISDSPTPHGWGNQLHTEPGLMLSWERSWPERYGFHALGWTGSMVPYAGATVGNIYTYANGGISLRLAPDSSLMQDAPVRVRPSMPGTGAFVVPDSTFSWYLFGGAESRLMARNIFLDGNTFTDSHSVDKKAVVSDFTGGLAFSYGRTRVSYALVYRTREFDTQDDPDIFGTITVGFRF